MSRRLENYVRNPYVGQIVYTTSNHALHSGKVVKINDPIEHHIKYPNGHEVSWTEHPVVVRWLNGRETVESHLRDSEADLSDRLRSYEQAKEAVERAKLL
jgi:hypothetical protein